jgi:type I restriction enzyme S subunit
MAFTTTVREVIDNDKTGLLKKHLSWERVQLIEVASILNGAPFDSAMFSITEGHPLIRIRDVLTGTTSTYYRGTYDEAYVVRHGELVVGMDGDFNSAYWGAVPALLNQRVCKITPDESFYSKAFLGHLLPGYLAAINANTSAITVKHLSSKTIGEIELPLPPRDEQTRIVEKLEELLSDLDAGVAELKAAQKKLGQYRQSLLKAAVEGALTAEWRKGHTPQETGAQLLARILTERRARWEAKQLAKFAEQGKTPPKDWQKKYPEPVQPDTSDLPELPEGWVWASLDMLSEIQGGIQKQPSRAPIANKYPFLRVANVARGILKLDDIHEIELFKGELERLALQKGDVLIVEGNGSLTEIGRCALWDGSIPNTVHQNHLIRARPIGMRSEFVETWLNSLRGIERLTALAATTSGLYTLSVGKISKIPVPVPPIDEQTATVNLLATALDEQKRQEIAAQLSLKQSAAQRKNILKAAFSGQLIPQDPNDEPASMLLERICAERAERDKQPKVRKTKQQKEIAAVVSKLKDVLAEAGDWVPAQEVFRRCGVADGSQTEQIEALYAELRELDKAGSLAVEAVTDAQGRKLHDRLKLVAG